MSSTRLNATVRKEILNHVMRDIFESRVEDLKKKSNQFAEMYYERVFGEEAAAILKLKLSFDWLTNLEVRLKFTVPIKGKGSNAKEVHLWTKDDSYGTLHKYSARTLPEDSLYTEKALQSSQVFVLAKARPLPPRESKLRKLDSRAAIIPLQVEGLALVSEEKKLRGELESFLWACNTYQQVIDTWPEGEKYLPVKALKKKLPIPLVDNVRRAMK